MESQISEQEYYSGFLRVLSRGLFEKHLEGFLLLQRITKQMSGWIWSQKMYVLKLCMLTQGPGVELFNLTETQIPALSVNYRMQKKASSPCVQDSTQETVFTSSLHASQQQTASALNTGMGRNTAQRINGVLCYSRREGGPRGSKEHGVDSSLYKTNSPTSDTTAQGLTSALIT